MLFTAREQIGSHLKSERKKKQQSQADVADANEGYIQLFAFAVANGA